MKFTTHFELHSQTTRLVEGVSHRPYHRSKTGFSPSLTFCSKKFKPRRYPKHPLQITTRTSRGQISNLSCCRFTRRYWGNPCWFLFLRLLICLSSARIPTWSEVNLERNFPVRGERTVPGAPLIRYVLSQEAQCTGGSTRLPSLSLGRAEGCTPSAKSSNTKHEAWGGVIMTLEQARPSEYQRAQCAFKDSMTHWNSAIRITYRISLRSSSMPEPRDPLLKVFAFELNKFT